MKNKILKLTLLQESRVEKEKIGRRYKKYFKNKLIWLLL